MRKTVEEENELNEFWKVGKNRCSQTKGITLIALVITVIVLIILAGVAISMLSGDNGILNQSIRAKEQTEQQSILEQIKLASMSSIETSGAVDTERLLTELNKIDGVNLDSVTLPTEIEIDGVHYGIEENGDAYVATWYYTEDKKITNGEIIIELGDTIDYDATVGEGGEKLDDSEFYYESKVEKNGNSNQTYKISDASELEWRVLGVEKGQILIMPTTNLATGGKNNDGLYYLGNQSSSDSTNSQNAYVNAVDELDNIGKIYGNGKGADKARSIKAEDINNITGRDITKTGEGGIGYGVDVTYSIGKDGYIYYDWSGATEHPTKNPNNYKTFIYYTGYEWKELDVGKTITLKNTLYYYDAQGDKDKINTNAWNMLFEQGGYLLNSSYIRAYQGGAYYGMLYIGNMSVYHHYLFGSYGSTYEINYGIRPVVYLKSNINLTSNGEKSWKIQ